MLGSMRFGAFKVSNTVLWFHVPKGINYVFTVCLQKTEFHTIPHGRPNIKDPNAVVQLSHSLR